MRRDLHGRRAPLAADLQHDVIGDRTMFVVQFGPRCLLDDFDGNSHFGLRTEIGLIDL